MFGFSKKQDGPPRIIYVKQGEGKRWRWYAEVGDTLVAQSGIRGYEDPKDCTKTALTYLSGQWSVVTIPN